MPVPGMVSGIPEPLRLNVHEWIYFIVKYLLDSQIASQLRDAQKTPHAEKLERVEHKLCAWTLKGSVAVSVKLHKQN